MPTSTKSRDNGTADDLDALAPSSDDLAYLADLDLDLDPNLPDEYRILSLAREWVQHTDIVTRARLSAKANHAVGNMTEFKRLSDMVRAAATAAALIAKREPQAPVMGRQIAKLNAHEEMLKIREAFAGLGKEDKA